MTTLQNLILKQKWPDLSARLNHLYSDVKEDLLNYKKTFETLQSLEAEKVEIAIIIQKQHEDQDYYYDVSGRHGTPKNEEDKYPQGLELTPWKLGMRISKETLVNFSPTDIVVHCLYEMTFAGFSEDAIPKTIRKIDHEKRVRKTTDDYVDPAVIYKYLHQKNDAHKD